MGQTGKKGGGEGRSVIILPSGLVIPDLYKLNYSWLVYNLLFDIHDSF